MMYVCLYVCMYVCVYIPREFGRNPIRLEKNNLHEAYGLLDWATLYMLETWMNVFLNTTHKNFSLTLRVLTMTMVLMV